MNIKTMTFTEFNKKIRGGKEKTHELVYVNPYFNFERWSSKLVYISSRIDEPTMMTYRRKPTALIIPRNGDVRTSLKPHIEILKQHVGVDATVLSIFGIDEQKLTQLSTS